MASPRIIHVVGDENGLPLQFDQTDGHVNETQTLDELRTTTDEDVVDLENQSVAWPSALAGDNRYRVQSFDELLLKLGILPVISLHYSDNRDERGVISDSGMSRERPIVELLLGGLKESRRVFSRFQETTTNFGGMIKLSSIHSYL